MDINYLRECYKSICLTNPKQFTESDLSKLNQVKKFGNEFTQIDLDLYMYINNNEYHIIKVNDDGSYNYSMFTRIERHDDSCTYVRNTLHPRFSL